MLFGKHPQATPAQRQQFKQLVKDMKCAFAYSLHDVKGYHGIRGPLEFQTISNKSVFCRPRRQSPLEVEITNKKCKEMLEAGIIEPSPTSAYASAPTLPPKKAPDGTWSDTRFCIDFVALNTILAPLHTPVPVADELFQQLGESCVFSKLDLRAGFFQIPLHPNSRALTSFWWGNTLYRFTRAPFGIKVCPAAFQLIMDTELQAAGCSDFTKVFIDDVLIHSNSVDEHLQHPSACQTVAC